MKEHICIHEEAIISQGRKIASLETRSEYKDRMIQESYNKIEKMESKIDTLNDNINHLILRSTKDDKELELRLKAIETGFEVQKRVNTRNAEKLNKTIGVLSIVLTILTIVINVIFKFL